MTDNTETGRIHTIFVHGTCQGCSIATVKSVSQFSLLAGENNATMILESESKERSMPPGEPIPGSFMAENSEDAAGDAMVDTDELVPEGEAVVYEEELLQNPYSLKLWLRYLQASNSPFSRPNSAVLLHPRTHGHANFCRETDLQSIFLGYRQK
jgi:hypothetical protein